MDSTGSRWPRAVEVLSAAQSVVVTLGIIVGALWTYHTFNAQLHAENAQAQLKKLNRELESEPRVGVDFKIVQVIPQGKFRHLIMERVIENKGNKEAYLSFGRQPVHIYEAFVVASGDTGLRQLRTALIRADGGNYAGGVKVPPGGGGSHQFMTYVEGPGIYAFEYSTPMSEAPDPQLAKAAGADKPIAEQSRWGTLKYFHIQ